MVKLFKKIRFAFEEFWLNLTFKSDYECGVHYDFISAEPFTKIKILRGRYRDVIYNHESISIKEPTNRFEHAVMSFNITIHDPSIYTVEYLMSDAGFINRVGEIITSIILKEAEPHKYEPYREDDFEESNIQSEVYEESVTVSKD